MIRKSYLLLLLLIPSASVFALGLGGIRVESALNEPLDARVGLISVDQLTADDIRVRLAGPEVFGRAGMERPYLLSKLRFKPVIPDNGDPYIRVSSRDSIREPFLDFLLEVRWPGGSLVREFTILLDPPTYQPPRTESVAEAPAPSMPATPPASPTTYGPVRSSETLWVIAGKVQADAAVSRNRTMIALLKANPDAFRGGNINLLRKGALLTIPTPEEIAAVSEQEARTAVRRQMEQWRKGRAPVVAAAPTDSRVAQRPEQVQPAAAPDPAPVEPAPAQTDDRQAKQSQVPPAMAGREAATMDDRQRLRVVEPDRNWQLGEQGDADYPVQESDRLREAIKDSEQELVAVQEINRDIIELRAALESKVAALRKALEEKDAELEKLRQQIARSGAIQAGAADTAGGQAPKPAPPGNLPVDAPVTEVSADDTVWKDEYWMMLMGAVIIILLILLLLNARGRKRQVPHEGPRLFEKSAETASHPPAKPQSSSTARLTEQVETPTSSVEVPGEPTDLEAGLSPLQSGDVGSILMEADIYLAYRRYSQAESLVQEAMEDNPDSPELKAKLLEIYAFRRDKKAFSSYLDQVYPVLQVQSPELWDKVVDMGLHLVPEHPAWKGEGESIEMILPTDGEQDRVGSADPDKLSRQSPFDLDVDLEDLEIPGEGSEAITFDDLVRRDEESEDDEIPSIDLDLDYENPKQPRQDK